MLRKENENIKYLMKNLYSKYNFKKSRGLKEIETTAISTENWIITLEQIGIKLDKCSAGGEC